MPLDQQSRLLQTLAQNRIHATAVLEHTQSQLQQFLQHLEATSLPLCCWPLAQLKHFSLLQKQNSQALRDFECTRPSPIDKPTNNQPLSLASDPPPAPPPPQRIYQNIKVEMVNGQPVTTAEPTAAFFVEKHAALGLDHVVRQFYFVNGIVPDPYAYVLTHDGVTCEPTEYFKISYFASDFHRLCQLELASQSPHVLDGPRRFYKRIHLINDLPSLTSQ